MNYLWIYNSCTCIVMISCSGYVSRPRLDRSQKFKMLISLKKKKIQSSWGIRESKVLLLCYRIIHYGSCFPIHSTRLIFSNAHVRILPWCEWRLSTVHLEIWENQLDLIKRGFNRNPSIFLYFQFLFQGRRLPVSSQCVQSCYTTQSQNVLVSFIIK